MDSPANKTLTLNEKCMVLLTLLEEYAHDNQKHMSVLMRGLWKPILNTVSMFVSIAPEIMLQQHIDKLRLLIEAMESNHTDRREFSDHIQSLL